MKPLIGRQRTHARRAVETLSAYDHTVVARLLNMRVHTISAILSGRMLPGPRFALAVTRVTSPN
jgi:hypothetical protein